MAEYHETLITPDGEEHISRSAVETNDLIYGSGYRRKSTATPTPPSPAEPTDEPPAETETAEESE